MHLHVAAWNNDNVTLSVAPTGYSDNIALTSNSGISNNTPFTFNGDPSTSDYYKVITFSEALTDNTELTFTATSGKRFVIWGVTAEEETTGDVVNTQVTIDASGITNTDVYTGTAAGSLTATVTETESGAAVSGATVTWTSSNESVATIASDGTVTLVAAGSTTITASYAGVEDEYKSSSATYQLTVTNSDPNAPGTENNPYTVAQARAAIDANTGVTGVYATGIVSEIVTPLNTQYGNISYNISVDGTTTADQLQAFRGKSYNGEIFTSADDIKVGDEVVVYGNLKKFNTTYEFDADNQLVSLNRPVSEDPEIQIADDELQLGSGANDNGTFNVTYTNEFVPVAAFAKLYNDADCTEEFDGDWIMVEESMDEDPSVITYVVEANTATTERSVYLYVEAMDNDANIISNVFTITQAAYEAPKFTWDLTTNSYSSESEDLVTWSSDFATMTNAKGSSTTKANNYLGGNNNHTRFYKNQVLTITPKLGYAVTSIVINAISNYVNGFNGENAWTNATVSVNGTVITVTPTNINLPVSVTISAACRATGVTVSYVESDVMVIKIKKDFTATTFSCDKALDFSAVEGITANIITDDKGSTAPVTTVRANTGLYIEGAEGYYEVPIIANADEISGNLLEATDGTTEFKSDESVTYYVFGKQNGKEAFYKVPASGYTPSANKAVLAIDAVNGAKEMIVIGGDVTGIESIENGTIVNDNYYTIDGKLVKGQPTQKGIYVVNGRKVVIK